MPNLIFLRRLLLTLEIKKAFHLLTRVYCIVSGTEVIWLFPIAIFASWNALKQPPNRVKVHHEILIEKSCKNRIYRGDFLANRVYLVDSWSLATFECHMIIFHFAWRFKCVVCVVFLLLRFFFGISNKMVCSFSIFMCPIQFMSVSWCLHFAMNVFFVWKSKIALALQR